MAQSTPSGSARFFLPTKWEWRMRPSGILWYRHDGRIGELPREMYRYLAKTESSALGGQIHEAVMIFPLATLIAGTVGIFALYTRLADDADSARSLLALGWAVLLAWVVWRWFEWNRDLIFITPYRIIKMHGIITRKVAMMPISKVTDMSYIKTPIGMLLGYGTFIVESAGQEQALRTIRFVPDPDKTYQYLQDRLFRNVPAEVHVTGVNIKEPKEDELPEELRPKPGKRIPVSWTGRLRKNGDGRNGHIEQDDGPPPW
jgi:hypothetical protein